MNEVVRVGIWLPLPAGSHWRGEGIGRTIEFMLKGFADADLIGREVEFVFVTSSAVEPDIRHNLQATLGDRAAQIRFAAINLPKDRWVKRIDGLVSLGGRLEYEPEQDLDRKLFERPPTGMRGVKYLKDRQDLEYARQIGRPPRSRRRGWHFASTPPAPKAPRIDDPLMPEHLKPLLLEDEPPGYDHDGKPRMQPGVRTIFALTKVKQPNSRRGRLFRWIKHQLDRMFTRLDLLQFYKQAYSKSRELEIDVWWVPSPNTWGVEFLRGPKLINFWDNVVAEYGFLWPQPEVDSIYHRVKLVLHQADRIVTQSRHNVPYKLVESFQIPNEKVSVCYLAAPSHYPRYVPSFAAGGLKTDETRAEAAELIRGYLRRKLEKSHRKRADFMHARGLELERLTQFPFESVKLAVISTQRRPYKNVAFAVDAFLTLVKRGEVDGYLILTTEFSLAKGGDDVGRLLHKHRIYDRVFAMSRIPNAVHAALYHCASLTLHPSFTEGGVGSYPFMEGMVMGTAGLVVEGDYTREGLRLHPDYGRIVIPGFDKRRAMRAIKAVFDDPEAAAREQRPLFEAHQRWSWAHVARVYAALFRRTAGRGGADAAKELVGMDAYFKL